MGDYNKMASEDDEDLEALRLAALQSLKKKQQKQPQNHEQIHNNNNNNNINSNKSEQQQLNNFNERINNKGRRGGKFFRNNSNRFVRNGQQNNWGRNSNLIAVPVVSAEPTLGEEPKNDVPKLILPQDRYCKPRDKDEEVTSSPISKFDRYDNSDNSESSDDDDDDNDHNEKEITTKTSESTENTSLKRANSLEALMEELENEIKGAPPKQQSGGENTKPPNKEEKVRIKRKKRIVPEVENEVLSTKENIPEPRPVPIQQQQQQKKLNGIQRTKKWSQKPPRRQRQQQSHNHFPPPPNNNLEFPNQVVPPTIPILPFLPTVPQFPVYSHPGAIDTIYQQPPVVPTIPPQAAPPSAILYETQPPPSQPPPPSHYIEPPPPHRVPVYDRPLSPLHVNTDSFTTTLAPLSPRSAAFVLENRAIIEKRKRRSYSRSPSPQHRYRRSISPRRPSKSPPKRRSSPSPPRKVLPPKTAPKKPTIYDRLGSKPLDKTEEIDSTTNTTTVKKESRNTKVEDKKIEDPILEARRKKFESNQITMKEGVIRLKAAAASSTTESTNNKIEKQDDDFNVDQMEDEIDEDALLNECGDDELQLQLSPKFDELFSDEESNSDNEGRFKIRQKSSEDNNKVVVMPFTKLLNGGSKNTDVKANLKLDEDNNRNSRGSLQRRRYRSRSPINSKQSVAQLQQLLPAVSKRTKILRTKRLERTSNKPKTFPIDNNKKIEIKIRNPAKYEEGDEHKSNSSINHINRENDSKQRKVEIMGSSDNGNTNEMLEVVDNNASENVDNADNKINEGDLRTQLSRKRAERQKNPLPDVVPSRLLQNALQSVGFKKSKKSKKEKEEAKDGKLPIRLRLGTTGSSNTPEMFGKKMRKRGSLEQV